MSGSMWGKYSLSTVAFIHLQSKELYHKLKHIENKLKKTAIETH